MPRTKFRQVISGALIASLVFVITEALVEGVAGIFGYSEMVLLAQVVPNIPPNTVLLQFGNVLQLFALMLIAIWLYSALRSNFSSGSKCALTIALMLWVTYAVISISFVRVGLLPANIIFMSLFFNAVEIPVALLAGAGAHDTAERKERESVRD